MWLKRALGLECLSLWELCEGNLGGGSFAGGPEGYERKALGMGISLHGGSVGQPGVGLSTGDFEMWLKRALGFDCGSSVKGIWREGFLAGDPERYVEKTYFFFVGAPFGEKGRGPIYRGI
jgi:hypothetical protein